MDGASLLGDELPDRNGKAIRGLENKVFSTADDFYADSTTVRDKFQLLATGAPIDDLFNISLEPSFNGLKLADLALAPGIDEIQIHNPSQFGHVDLESNYLPAFISGQAPALNPGTALAVALNGKIVTVTHVFYGATGHHKFAAILPESEFRQGENVLSIHRIETKKGVRRLYQSNIEPMTNW